MVKRAVLGYLAAELLAVVGLVWAFGIGWTLAIIAGTFLVGVILAASQLRGQLGALRRAGTDPRTAVTDGALVGLGAVLVLLPGVVSTAAGSLLLVPPTRGVLRPAAVALLTRGVVRRVGAVGMPSSAYRSRYAGGEVIDGEVIDGPIIDGDDIAVVPGVPANLPVRR